MKIVGRQSPMRRACLFLREGRGGVDLGAIGIGTMRERRVVTDVQMGGTGRDAVSGG